MFAAEFLIGIGTLMVLCSMMMLGVAHYVRAWFFLPDPLTEWKVVGKSKQ